MNIDTGEKKQKKINSNGDTISSGVEKRSDDGLAKIGISREADGALGEIVYKVSEGFDGARVVKQDVASYIILEFLNSFDESDIYKIRRLFFDTKAMIRAVLKKADETGYMPEDVEELFRKRFEATSQVTKKSKKSLKSDVIIDNITSNEEVA